MAKKESVLVVLHFEHGVTEERIMEALKLGYTSIRYDCSTDAYENNVKRVAEMVKIAKAFGASVEAELGYARANEGNPGREDVDDDDIYTQPAQAKDFTERTDVDALAVVIGTAHGAYEKYKDGLRQTNIQNQVIEAVKQETMKKIKAGWAKQ